MAERLNEFNFFWMNENSKGIINDVLLEVDFNLINNKVQFIDVTGKFNCSNITITYMENMQKLVI